MQRQRGELVPIGEVVSGLDDVLVPAFRAATPAPTPATGKSNKRVNGPYRLYLQAGPKNKLPYGNLPGCVPKRCGPKAARSSWVVRFPGSCGSWISTAPAAEAGESGHGSLS